MKARKKLAWQPRVDFKGLVNMMVDSDLKLVSQKKSG
jgi:GDP-D-mannose dehydratase